MAVTLEAKRRATMDRILAQAYKIIDQSWIDAGVTQEELDREDLMIEVYDGLIGQGKTRCEAQEYLTQTLWEEMERKHRELFPRLYETK